MKNVQIAFFRIFLLGLFCICHTGWGLYEWLQDCFIILERGKKTLESYDYYRANNSNCIGALFIICLIFHRHNHDISAYYPIPKIIYLYHNTGVSFALLYWQMQFFI